MSSTVKNLQFLEAQLSQYLHSHEDDGTTLWVTPQGFRMPYKKTRENLETNMRYVEVQLEKYLHDHFVDVKSESGAEIAIDPEVDLTTSFSGPGEAGDPGEYFWVDSNNRTVVQSQTNPNNGANHIRVEITGNSGHSVTVADPAITGGANRPRTGTCSPGDQISASVYAASNTTKQFWGGVYFFNSGEGTVESNDDLLGTLSSSYQKFTAPTRTAPANAAKFNVYFYPLTPTSAGMIFDYDTFSVIGSADVDTLFIRPAGFRFPYGWETDGDININMKFLETEISKYLHKHEEGVA